MNSSIFTKGLWVWHSAECGKDEYAEFLDRFNYAGGGAECLISCRDDYALYINGKFAASNQYSDFDHYKIYDRIDLSPFLCEGENVFALLVWYCGGNSMRFCPSESGGAIFEITGNDGACLLHSSEATPSRKSLAYLSGRQKSITSQLGYSYLYDSTKEDGWINGDGTGFSPSAVLKKDGFTFFERPIKKALHLEPKKSEIIEKSNGGCHYTVDVGAETVGLFTVKFTSPADQLITMSYGEDLQNGHVRRFIHKRDFSFEYVASKGENEFTNYILRLGCRYIEIDSESPIELEFASVIPQVYPTKPKKVQIDGEEERGIYDICLSTLELCMMEHYVDCPWREQGLYAFDSRNQMLFGYHAYEDGNFEYARANLLLMAKDRRHDGLLSICFPCTNHLAIPSFSLHYFSSIEEYTRYSGDLSLAREIHEKLVSVMEVFLNNMADGLVCFFKNEGQWNFYDWAKDLDGYKKDPTLPDADCIINCLTVRALEAFKKICTYASLPFPYEGKADALRARIREEFYCEDKGLFAMYRGRDIFNVHSNILAILADVVTGDEARELCDRTLAAEDITDCTLSLKALKYDALLKADPEKHRETVLSEIKTDYLPMLKAGATSAWETAEGAPAFGNAGSLCHGWSAAPVYYYSLLGIAR